jgi:D-lactate dehydrogenase (cytochrome)
MRESLIKPFEEKYTDYLKDESGLSGCADEISFPSGSDDLRTVLDYLISNKKPFTVQGARTGITGGCVPDHGHILNLSYMNKITGMKIRDNVFFLEVQPGVCLCDINKGLYNRSFDTQGWSEASLTVYTQFRKAKRCFFPPNPTETTASIGGMFSSNAAGPNVCHYGKTSAYVDALSIALASGENWNIARGQYVFDAKGCALPNGKNLRLPHESSSLLPFTSRAGLDLIDFLAGSEGMLCIIESLTLRLLPEPENSWGVVCLFKSNKKAICFSKAILEQSYNDVLVTAIEYLDQQTLGLVMALKANASRLAGIPDIPLDIEACVYIELISHTSDDLVMENALLSLLELLTDCGGDPDMTWAAANKEEIEKFRLFRHAAPEAVNLKNSEYRMSVPRLTKTATDFSAPNKYLTQILEMYYADIQRSNISSAIFGHIDQCHFHVNFLPTNSEEMQIAQCIISGWAKEITTRDGCVANENGIGKLKKNLLANVISEADKQNILYVKQFFDPKQLMNPGNLI